MGEGNLGPALAIMQSKVYIKINIKFSLLNRRDFHNWKGEKVEVSSRLAEGSMIRSRLVVLHI